MSTHTVPATDIQTTIVHQIGRWNIAAISGGRIISIDNGIELPVSSGYRVRIILTPADDYTVERIQVRGGKIYSHGVKDGVYAENIADVAYRASSFRSYTRDEW